MSVGISAYDGCNMPMVAQPLRELPTLSVCFSRELPKVCGPFFVALAVCATVVQPLAYRGRHSMICQWIRGQVIAKIIGSGEPVFTSMEALLYRM
jgi:hypothetical protein